MKPIDKFMAILKDQVGYLEKKTNAQLDDKTANAGNKNFTKYSRDLDALNTYNGKKNGYAWCCVFVCWCFVTAFGLETGLKMLYQVLGGYGASCTWAAKYYKQAGRFFKTPEVGDQIFFTNDGGKSSNHTGIVVKIDGNKVYTIEGNTSSASGVVANGGGVFRKSYLIGSKSIYGYGRPDWSLVERKDEVDMTKEEVQNLVKEEVKKAVADLKPTIYKSVNDIPSWGIDTVEKLVNQNKLRGDQDGNLNLSEDLLRALVIMSR